MGLIIHVGFRLAVSVNAWIGVSNEKTYLPFHSRVVCQVSLHQPSCNNGPALLPDVVQCRPTPFHCKSRIRCLC